MRHCHWERGENDESMTIMLMGCGGVDALLDGDQDHNHLRDVVRGQKEKERVVKVNKSQLKKSFELDQIYC